MDTTDKIYFAFSAYDFDNAGSLSFDEATLLLRSVVQGLGKVSPSNVIFTSPSSKEVEQFTALVLASRARLEALYAGPLDDAAKRAGKNRVVVASLPPPAAIRDKTAG